MAFTLRGRTVSYDNLASGSASGRERTILGETPSTEIYGGGINTGANITGHSNVASGVTDYGPEQVGTSSPAKGGDTDQNTTDPTVELLG